MDVYLVPTGGDRHELYCESADPPAAPSPARAGRLWRRLQEAFGSVLAAVEREQERADSAQPSHPPGLTARVKARAFRWLAERVAEQRLLWKLRGQTAVRALHAPQIDAAAAESIVRRALGADASRHRRWLVLDTVFLGFALLLTPLPGPNVPGYYFTFRVVGHFLAVRGARHGLRGVKWEFQPSEPLAELVGLEHLQPAERAARVRDIAGRLGLARLARFFERTAVGTA